ncbi:MAG: hypothetical protein IIU87_05650 [Prevotella sp.]|nr:hypothetical protein [Prevotella sp.]
MRLRICRQNCVNTQKCTFIEDKQEQKRKQEQRSLTLTDESFTELYSADGTNICKKTQAKS